MFSAPLLNLQHRNCLKQRSLIHSQREEFEAEALMILMTFLSRPLIFDEFPHLSPQAAKLSEELLTVMTFLQGSLLWTLGLVLQ